MTLCLAWSNQNRFYFASDSRLTDKEKNVVSDEATKIFKIDVVIYGTTSHEDPHREPEVLHRTTYGMCFAGSYLNGSILADTVDEVLSNIQAVPDHSDISIENLSNIAFAVYKKVSIWLMEKHREYGLSSVFFGGRCLDMGMYRFYKFSALYSGQEIAFQKEEIYLTDVPVFLGDSTPIGKAEELIALNRPRDTPSHLLRDIIQDKDCKTVGGNMQFGEFGSDHFKTIGIIEYSLEPNDLGIQQVKSHFNYRGLSFDLKDNELRSGDINILKSFFNPFEPESWELYERETKQSIEEYLDKWEAAAKKKTDKNE